MSATPTNRDLAVCPGGGGALRDAQLLIIDDDPIVGRALGRILSRAGCGQVDTETDPTKALERCRTVDFDGILLDLHMPGLDGFDVMERLTKGRDRDDYTPVLVLTGEQSVHVRSRALASGAKDFVQKPFEPAEVVARVRNLVETRRMHRRLRSFNAELERRVAERTAEAVMAKIEVLERLARAGEYRDDMTGQHAQRVGRLAGLLSEELGLDHQRVEIIRRAAPLHDIGKIGVSDTVLLKQGSLTPEEIAHIRQHTVFGADILEGSNHPLLQAAERIARTHHEFWDGRGYPLGLREEEIPDEGRIVAVADAFDSMTNDRPYRKACSHADAVEEVLRCRGRQFAPDVVDALCRLHRRGVLADVFPPASPDSSGSQTLDLHAAARRRRGRSWGAPATRTGADVGALVFDYPVS